MYFSNLTDRHHFRTILLDSYARPYADRRLKRYYYVSLLQTFLRQNTIIIDDTRATYDFEIICFLRIDLETN